VGMALEKHICVALFARYDRQRRGYIDYTEFIDHLMEKVFFTPEEAKHIGSKVEVLRLHLKKNGTLKDLDALVQDKTPLQQVCAERDKREMSFSLDFDVCALDIYY
jgi:hypothetical protein